MWNQQPTQLLIKKEFKKSKIILALAYLQAASLVVIILGSVVDVIFSDSGYRFDPRTFLALLGPIFASVVIFTKKSTIYKIASFVLVVYTLFQIFSWINLANRDLSTDLPTVKAY